MHRMLKTMLWCALLAGGFALGLFAGPKAVGLYRTWFPPPEYRTGDFAALYARAGHPVVMYATVTCPYCAKARALFARHGVRYTEYQIDRSAAASADFQRRGGVGVPLLFIGDRRIEGYRERAIIEALETLAPDDARVRGGG